MCMSHTAHEEAGGKLAGLSFLLLPCWVWGIKLTPLGLAPLPSELPCLLGLNFFYRHCISLSFRFIKIPPNGQINIPLKPEHTVPTTGG